MSRGGRGRRARRSPRAARGTFSRRGWRCGGAWWGARWPTPRARVYRCVLWKKATLTSARVREPISIVQKASRHASYTHLDVSQNATWGKYGLPLSTRWSRAEAAEVPSLASGASACCVMRSSASRSGDAPKTSRAVRHTPTASVTRFIGTCADARAKTRKSYVKVSPREVAHRGADRACARKPGGFVTSVQRHQERGGRQSLRRRLVRGRLGLDRAPERVRQRRLRVFRVFGLFEQHFPSLLTEGKMTRVVSECDGRKNGRLP